MTSTLCIESPKSPSGTEPFFFLCFSLVSGIFALPGGIEYGTIDKYLTAGLHFPVYVRRRYLFCLQINLPIHMFWRGYWRDPEGMVLTG